VAALSVDVIVKDGDRVELGGTTLVAHLTPGHTRGATTWTTTVDEDGRRLSVVFFPSANVPPARACSKPRLPERGFRFRAQFCGLEVVALRFVPRSARGVFDVESKRKRQKNGARPNPFIDSAGYRRVVAEAEQEFREALANER